MTRTGSTFSGGAHGAPTRRLAVVLVAALALISAAAMPAAAVTPEEAKAFFKEFDDATLRQKGPVPDAIYGPTAADKVKLAKDIFDGAGDVAGKAIRNQILDANGKPVKPEDRKAVDDAYQKLKDSGAMGKLSDLQIRIINKHFKKADGTSDFAKFQEAMEMFANGELRTGGGGGIGEMNQLYQWVAWKQFAEAAIRLDVDKASWETILKSLEKGLEIYRRVYPAPAGAAGDFNGELTASDVDRFDATEQLTAAEKTALRTAIDALSTADIIAREKNLINDMTTAAVAPGPEELKFASVSTRASALGLIVDLSLELTDGFGNAISDATIALFAREIGFVLGPDRFSLEFPALPVGGGLYEAEFLMPITFTGVSVLAFDEASLAFTSTAIAPVPEPSSIALLLTAAVGCLLVRVSARGVTTSAASTSRSWLLSAPFDGENEPWKTMEPMVKASRDCVRSRQ